jgi:hypothetical protein
VLIRMHSRSTSRSDAHPQIASGQEHLTLKFFGDELSGKKLQLVGMSILSILLSPWPRCHHYLIFRSVAWVHHYHYPSSLFRQLGHSDLSSIFSVPSGKVFL